MTVKNEMNFGKASEDTAIQENFRCKKPIELLAREIHYEPLAPEVHIAVIAAWRRGGLLPRAAIEQMVPRLSQLH